MRLGIDFGTTRIVVAAVDRGNYPVVSFDCPDGAAREWIPPLIAVDGHTERLLCGWDAWTALGRPETTVVRSLKRVLPDAGPETPISAGPLHIAALELVAALARYLMTALRAHSSLQIPQREPLEIMLGVPAGANSNQRFLTVEGFRAAGFQVLGLLNEPSAASIEYSHRLGDKSSAADQILVYDLGGGTFDVSLVRRDECSHSVVATQGVATLGGDDFDDILASLALEAAGRPIDRARLSQAEEFHLLDECREKKESLNPNTRRLIIDLDRVRDGWGQAVVPVADFYEKCQPLIDETLFAAEEVLARAAVSRPTTLYVTGGASELPLVGRLLREKFGRRVKRSAYTRAATAIGLAIQAGGQSEYHIRDSFSRWFGVWREAEAGRRIAFDPLFEKGVQLPLPGQPQLERVRRYSPVHNIGHFRYLECTERSAAFEPSGDVTHWDEIRFPFDPALAGHQDLDLIPITRSAAASGQTIEERYTADSSGSIQVRIRNATAGYERSYTLGKWSSKRASATPLRPGRRRSAQARKAR
jgi:molecular chaperone DnaK (HSP70)